MPPSLDLSWESNLNTKGNQHWRETDEAIVKAVVRMADELGVPGVSVTAVCNKLGINRSTFYTHYEDVGDVMASVERKLGSQLAEDMAEALGESRRAAFEALFAHVADNAWFYGPHLRHGGSISVLGRFEGSPLLAGLPLDHGNEEIDYRLAFFRGGVTALITRWLDRGCPESPGQMCDVLANEYRAWEQVAELSAAPKTMRPAAGA